MSPNAQVEEKKARQAYRVHEMAGNPNDQRRDELLRFLYQRHKHARGIAKIPIGIRDLQREMKHEHAMTQQDVASNLDYLVQVQWVREVVKERSITTKGGMKLGQEQVRYKISDIGINHLEAGTMFKKPQVGSAVNITNVQGVTVVGDGNIVNTSFTDLSRALDDLDGALSVCERLSDEQKLDAAGDLSTIRTQIGKKNPNPRIVAAAWESLKAMSTVAGATQLVQQISQLVAPLFT